MLSIFMYGVLLYTIGKVVDWITFLSTGSVFELSDKILISLSLLYILLFVINGGI